MKTYDEIPSINFVFHDKEKIIIYFENGEIKHLTKSLVPDNKHTIEIKKINIWKNVKNDKFSIYFPDYKILKQPFSIGHDTVYELSEPFNQVDLIIKHLRIYKGLTQLDLAKKINLPASELSLIEKGKKTNLKLISRILSALI